MPKPLLPDIEINPKHCIRPDGGDYAIDIHPRVLLSEKAVLAKEIVAYVAYASGDDLNAIVKRTCDIVDELYAEMERRGWTADVPSMADCRQLAIVKAAQLKADLAQLDADRKAARAAKTAETQAAAMRAIVETEKGV